ncbi:MAG: nitrate- and nitrite sensing domain-containing protein [Gammaproteobacteria bacterium]|nr:nitrate- and nitrite sensing domain-containing protein [Gammaproteobacteria bacterium]
MNFHFLDQMRLRSKVLILLAVPLLGLAWLSFDHVIETMEDFRAAKEISDWLTLSRLADATSHEVMEEGKLANVFALSDTKLREHELRRQQRETDKRISALLGNVQQLMAGLDDALSREHLDELLARLERFQAARISLFEGGVEATALDGMYSALVRALIAISSEIPRISRLDQVDSYAYAMTALMEVNLDASRERDLVAAGLREGAFKDTEFVEFKRLMQKQEAGLEHIAAIEDRAFREAMMDALDHESMHRLEVMRQTLIADQERSWLLAELTAAAGHVGLLGDVTQYLRDGNPESLERFEYHYKFAMARLDALEKHAAHFGNSKAALSDIRTTLGRFQQKMTALKDGARKIPGIDKDTDLLTRALTALADTRLTVTAPAWESAAEERIQHLLLIEDRVTRGLYDVVALVEANRTRSAWIIGVVNALMVFAALWIAYVIGCGILRQLGADPHTLSRGVREIANGNLDVDLGDGKATGVLADMRVMQQNLRDNVGTISRAQQALQAVTSSIMLADRDYNVIFANRALMKMFSLAEDDIRREFPAFDARDIGGMNMDRFHKDPAMIRARLDQLTGPFQGQIEIGVRHFQIIATPVVNDHGARIATVIEWQDRTQEVAVENEVQAIVDSSRHGTLSQRIDLRGKEGFFKVLSEGINSLLATNEAIIGETQRVFSALAKGDLTQTIDADYEGEFGRLQHDANKTVETFLDVIGRIQDATSTVRSAAVEIAQGNANLSVRTENQAASLEETAASMEQMTGTVKKNADSARESSRLALDARDQADEGGRVVGEAVTAMREISASSRRIAEIIGVIDEIAFQTNLLSLNAAVEAARAGEQGRGFAVVAGEVGKLAQRSATAAKEIKDLIEDSSQKVVEGARLVNASGEMLDGIVGSVNKVSALIAEIAHSSNEQSTGIEQVNTAVVQMDVGTQQNAALVEEIAAASHSMEEQVRALGKLIDFFSAGTSGMSSVPGVHRETVSAPKPRVSAANDTRKAATGTWDDDDDWEEF